MTSATEAPPAAEAAAEKAAPSIGDFAKKCMMALINLEPRSKEDANEIKSVVLKLVQLYSMGGPEAAEEKFKQQYDAFRAVAEANAAMQEAEKVAALAPIKAKSRGLERVGDTVSGLNLAQVHLAGGLISNLPFFGEQVGGALKTLAGLEQTIIGLTGHPQIFRTLGALIKTTDTKLKEHGINTTVDGLKDHLGDVMNSEALRNAMEAGSRIPVLGQAVQKLQNAGAPTTPAVAHSSPAGKTH